MSNRSPEIDASVILTFCKQNQTNDDSNAGKHLRYI